MLPALLIDVDGPLNPYQADPADLPGYRTYQFLVSAGGSLRVRLNASHGAELTALGERFELCWATAWEQDANRCIAPRIGLPNLPRVRFGPDPPGPVATLDPIGAVHWKTEAIARAMVGRYFVWIDDEITEADAEYLALRHSAGSILYWIDPAIGLLPRDFRRIAALADGSQYGFLAGQQSRTADAPWVRSPAGSGHRRSEG